MSAGERNTADNASSDNISSCDYPVIRRYR